MNYREQLLESIQSLITIRVSIFTQIVNLAMLGESKSISDAFSVDETFEFELGHFEGSDDQNLLLLIEQCHNVETCVDSIINLNAITEQELEDAGIRF